MTALTITDADIGTKLHGNFALTAGGSSSIGQGIAHSFTRADCKVLIGDLQPPTESIDGSIYQECDAGNWDPLLLLFKRGIQEFERTDIVVPNAGFGDQGDYFDHVLPNGDPLNPEFDCLKVTLIGQMYTMKLNPFSQYIAPKSHSKRSCLPASRAYQANSSFPPSSLSSTHPPNH